MANPWFRLWADMINDPKWRTIARVSKQKIGDVIAVYVHMMTCASNAEQRGHTEGWCDEDVATALDIDTEQVEAIREAMQGRVLDGDYLTGWAKRQPKREREEEPSTDRVRAFRERQRSETPCNTMEHHGTPREDKRREEEKREEPSSKTKAAPDGELFPGIAEQVVSDFKAMRKTQKAPITQTSIDGIRREASKAGISLEDALKMCCERSWRGFKAEWVAGSQQARASPSGPSQLGKAGQATAANAQRLLEQWRQENG